MTTKVHEVLGEEVGKICDKYSLSAEDRGKIDELFKEWEVSPSGLAEKLGAIQKIFKEDFGAMRRTLPAISEINLAFAQKQIGRLRGR